MGGGAALLLGTVNVLTAALGATAGVVYVALYTPLKRVTTLNTLAGAIVGALPPMMGWSAATGRLDAGAYVLGAILFVWQIPHFLATAWMYRDDYRRGGLRMLPVVDESGTTTARMVLLYSLALIPVSLMAFGVRPPIWVVLVPVIGFVTAYLFAAIGLIVTSYVKMINNFAFFTSGVITPLFFFSGTFFPILWQHHWAIDTIAMIVPLTHAIEVSRAVFKGDFTLLTLLHAGILLAYVTVAHVIALRRMTRRVLA